jgi:hypothetical protein
MRFALFTGPSHTIPSLPIRALNPDGSIELYDGRTFHHSQKVGIEYDHSAARTALSDLIFDEPLGTRYRVEINPPNVQVRTANGALESEYQFRGGNWYWMVSLGMKLTLLWHRWSPWAWTRRHGL